MCVCCCIAIFNWWQATFAPYINWTTSYTRSQPSSAALNIYYQHREHLFVIFTLSYSSSFRIVVGNGRAEERASRWWWIVVIGDGKKSVEGERKKLSTWNFSRLRPQKFLAHQLGWLTSLDDIFICQWRRLTVSLLYWCPSPPLIAHQTYEKISLNAPPKKKLCSWDEEKSNKFFSLHFAKTIDPNFTIFTRTFAIKIGISSND